MALGGTTNCMRTELPEGSTLRFHMDRNDQAYWLVADDGRDYDDDAPDGRNLKKGL